MYHKEFRCIYKTILFYYQLTVTYQQRSHEELFCFARPWASSVWRAVLLTKTLFLIICFGPKPQTACTYRRTLPPLSGPHQKILTACSQIANCLVVVHKLIVAPSYESFLKLIGIKCKHKIKNGVRKKWHLKWKLQLKIWRKRLKINFIKMTFVKFSSKIKCTQNEI